MLKELLLPPGSLIVAVLAAMFLFRRAPAAPRRLLWLAMGLLYAASIPLVSQALIRSLQWYPPLVPGEAGPQAIIVLSAGRDRGVPMYGGDTVDALGLERLRYAARLQRTTSLPLLVSGGPPAEGARIPPLADLMADALLRDFGIEARWREDRSTNTAENARLSTEMMAGAGIARVYLVTHAWHLPRAVMAFRASGLAVVPAPASHLGPPTFEAAALTPNARALAETAYALHEWVGIGWYALFYRF